MADKTKDGLISSLAISIGAVLIILVVLIIVGLDTRNIAEEALTSKSELNMRIDQLSKLAQLREEAKLAEPKFETLENILPERDELFSFAEEVEALGREHDVNASFSFGGESEESIVYGISAVGTYDDIIGFVEAIENEIVFMNIFSMDMIEVDGGYSAEINGRVYFNEQG